ncbi:MAG: MmgE/PrpD family protein [Armatimonadetes bacterium]|nr:MmgE/PrpD family protein [Armatimonadota bacterium]
MPMLARRLAEYALSIGFERLPPEDVHEVKRRVLDSLGCAYGAYHSDVARIARAVAGGCEARPGATVWGTTQRSLPALAAFANGAMVRYLDYNDTYLSLEPAHPSDNIPACAAAAEAANADGRALIAAILLAYEIQCRLCDAATIRRRGWDHVTYGYFSTALAAGRLMGLDADRLEQAVNLAGVNSAALRQTRVGQLSMWKGCAFANAARNGLFAAWLAAEGMTGPEEIFEGPMGFWCQVSGPFHLGTLGSEGEPFMIRQTSIKFWPAEYHSQSAIDAALALRGEIQDLDAIEAVDVYSFDAAVDIIGGEPEKWRPTTRETADHSLPYCIAVALMDGAVDLEQFSEARIADPALHALMDRIQIHRDAELTARYPEGIPNRLEVTLRGGTRLAREITYPRGHARNPMTDAEVEAKFTRLARNVLPEAQVGQIRDLVWRLDTLTDLAEFTAALVVPKAFGTDRLRLR